MIFNTTTFRNTMIYKNPEVIISTRKQGITSYDTQFILGDFYRVVPENPKEVFLIQMLEHQHEKFAPANGDGILLTKSALEKLTSQN